MEKLRVTQEMVVQAARQLAAECGWDEQQVQDIGEWGIDFHDGYELAQMLDEQCMWDMDAEQVAKLDRVFDKVMELYGEERDKWAIEENPQPSLH
ncbi:MAG: hypothetical protein ACYC9L_02955 [Sulfuricaulis sp.]